MTNAEPASDVTADVVAIHARNFRVDDALWVGACRRAAEEGTNVSVLIRQWLQDYVDRGRVDSAPKIRLSASERDDLVDMLSEKLNLGELVSAAVDYVNEVR